MHPVADELPHDATSLETRNTALGRRIHGPSRCDSGSRNRMTDGSVIMVVVVCKLVDESLKGIGRYILGFLVPLLMYSLFRRFGGLRVRRST
jgi:hypothetical protein